VAKSKMMEPKTSKNTEAASLERTLL
jgi:hypothetical protein